MCGMYECVSSSPAAIGRLLNIAILPPIRREWQFGEHEWLNNAASEKKAAPYLMRRTAESSENALLATARKTARTSLSSHANWAESQGNAEDFSRLSSRLSVTYSLAQALRLPCSRSACVSSHSSDCSGQPATAAPGLSSAPRERTLAIGRPGFRNLVELAPGDGGGACFALARGGPPRRGAAIIHCCRRGFSARPFRYPPGARRRGGERRWGPFRAGCQAACACRVRRAHDGELAERLLHSL